MIFKVPSYNQQLDVKNKSWKRRACGIVALKMLIDYWRPGKNAPADTLIKQGLRLNAYLKGIGWKHKELTLLANHHGLKGKNFDWFKDTPTSAFKKLRTHLKRYPVLASIYKDLKPGNSGHLVALTGLKNKLIFYNDPDSKTRKGVVKKTNIANFLRGWRRRVIVIYSARVV